MRQSAYRTLLLTLPLLTVSLLPAQAQEPGVELPRTSSTSERELKEELLFLQEETVSIAARHDQPISEAPSNVYVITDEDIRRSGATDIPTVLRRVPGIDVIQMSGADYNVAARGDNQAVARRMLVMVDGRSIYIDALGFVYWKSLPVTLPEIKRIEVLKGPASAVYGFNAVDGVINIITKSPEEMKGTTLQFGGGQLGTIYSAAVHAGTAGNLGYRLSYGHDQNQQWNDRQSLAFLSDTFNAQTVYTFSPHSQAHLSGGVVDTQTFDGPVAETIRGPARPTLAYAHAGYEWNDFLVRAFWNGYYDNVDVRPPALLASLIQFQGVNGGSMFHYNGNTYNVDVQHAVRLGPSRTTYGVNYRRNDFATAFISETTTENRLGLFANEELTVTRQVTISAGVRYDLDTFINPTLSPRVALIYSPAANHTFRATYSVAYRPPTIFEEQIVGNLSTTLPPPAPSLPPVTIVPSRNLEPERLVSYEVSYQGWFWDHRLRARTSLYFNHLNDLIIFQASGAIANRTNSSGSADLYGGEAGLEWLATPWLSGFANYSYVQIRQSFSDVAMRGAPQSKFNLGLRANWQNGLNAEATFYYVGSAQYPIGSVYPSLAPFFPPGSVVPNEHVDSYSLLNMRAGYRVWQEQASAGYLRQAEVAVSVLNALDDQHQEHPLGDTIGRIVMGWLTVRY